jgi:hypothetical protein
MESTERKRVASDVSPQLARELKSRATAARRSVSAEIAILLEQAVVMLPVQQPTSSEVSR